MRHESILHTVGSTPSVRLRKLASAGAAVYAKLESFNPMGSVKDRLALGIIEDAERTGQIKPGQTVIEATSGNTGIGLAMVCAAKGYPLVVTMAENFSVERRRLMRFLGARVVLTPPAQKGSGMLAKATELAREHGWFLCRQFENEANADIHSRTTAREILADFAGGRLDAFVTGYGTGGTLKGVARVLREHRPETRIIVCEPDNSQVLGSGIAQPRLGDGAPAASHPLFRPHLMQGWSPDFIPKLAEDARAAGLIDEVRPVNGGEALRLARALATEEGILAGISGGRDPCGRTGGGSRHCHRRPSCCACCPTPASATCRRRCSPISPRTCRMRSWRCRARRRASDSTSPPSPAPVAPEPVAAAVVAPDAERFVRDALADPGQPVVMFALEWCEFCWSARRMLARVGVPYRSIDLDSVEYQADGRGGAIRTALSARTGMATIPQIFIGGELVGGATDLFEAWRAGRAQALLERNGVAFDRAAVGDPFAFLPAWLQPRPAA